MQDPAVGHLLRWADTWRGSRVHARGPEMAPNGPWWEMGNGAQVNKEGSGSSGGGGVGPGGACSLPSRPAGRLSQPCSAGHSGPIGVPWGGPGSFPSGLQGRVRGCVSPCHSPPALGRDPHPHRGGLGTGPWSLGALRQGVPRGSGGPGPRGQVGLAGPSPELQRRASLAP